MNKGIRVTKNEAEYIQKRFDEIEHPLFENKVEADKYTEELVEKLRREYYLYD